MTVLFQCHVDDGQSTSSGPYYSALIHPGRWCPTNIALMVEPEEAVHRFEATDQLPATSDRAAHFSGWDGPAWTADYSGTLRKPQVCPAILTPIGCGAGTMDRGAI